MHKVFADSFPCNLWDWSQEMNMKKDFCQKIRKYFFLFFLNLRHIEIDVIQIFRLVKVKWSFC